MVTTHRFTPRGLVAKWIRFNGDVNSCEAIDKKDSWGGSAGIGTRWRSPGAEQYTCPLILYGPCEIYVPPSSPSITEWKVLQFWLSDWLHFVWFISLRTNNATQHNFIWCRRKRWQKGANINSLVWVPLVGGVAHEGASRKTTEAAPPKG